jgi:hypothetical protein
MIKIRKGIIVVEKLINNKINKNKTWFFRKVNEIGKSTLRKKKEGKVPNTKHEEYTTRILRDIKNIKKENHEQFYVNKSDNLD